MLLTLFGREFWFLHGTLLFRPLLLKCGSQVLSVSITWKLGGHADSPNSITFLRAVRDTFGRCQRGAVDAVGDAEAGKMREDRAWPWGRGQRRNGEPSRKRSRTVGLSHRGPEPRDLCLSFSRGHGRARPRVSPEALPLRAECNRQWCEGRP